MSGDTGYPPIEDHGVIGDLHTVALVAIDGSIDFPRRAGGRRRTRPGADGVRVNCTLGFSRRQHRLIADFAQPHFVNVFLGRVDSLLDAGDVHVPGSGGTAAALASQRMLDRWRDDADAAHPVRQIAASLRSAAQLPALAGIDVLTIPVDMAREFPASDVSPDAIVDRTPATPEPADLDALRAVGLEGPRPPRNGPC